MLRTRNIILIFIAVLLIMGATLDTWSGKYSRARTVSSDDSALSGYDFANKPLGAVKAQVGGKWLTGFGQETKANAIEIIISADGEDGDTFTVQYYGWANKNGPALDIANVTYTLGTRNVTKLPDGMIDADDVWIDTGTENEDTHAANVKCDDNGNNHINKTYFDLTGLFWWYPKVTGVTSGSGDNDPNSVKIWYRYY